MRNLKKKMVAGFLGMLGPVFAGTCDAQSANRSEILVVLGASGTEEYGANFREWGERWKEACKGWDLTLIDGTQKPKASKEGEPKEDRQILLDWIAKDSASTGPRWLVMIGHGTSNQKISKFNLRGPDISSEELGKSLDNAKGKWIIVDCTSCSGPFLSALSKPDRVIVSATKSGSELNFSRFGDFFSKAILDSKSDLDHDDSVSVLEAFLSASKQVEEFYKSENRLASEHALLDDNGDKQGAAASFYRGVRPAKTPEKGKELDGRVANRFSVGEAKNELQWTAEQRAKRDEIEVKFEELRSRKKELPEEEYYRQLEVLCVELAKLLPPRK